MRAPSFLLHFFDMAFFLGRRHVLHYEPFICHGGIGHVFLKIQISLRCPEHGDKMGVGVSRRLIRLKLVAVQEEE